MSLFNKAKKIKNESGNYADILNLAGIISRFIKVSHECSSNEPRPKGGRMLLESKRQEILSVVEGD